MSEKEKESPNEFHEMLGQTLIVLQQFMDNIDKKPINPEVSMDKVIAELLEMEKQIDAFNDANKELFASSKAEYDAKQEKSKETQRLLKKANQLVAEAETKKQWLTAKMNAAKSEEKEAALKKTESKKTPKEASRKSKLRRLGGGNKNWKPL